MVVGIDRTAGKGVGATSADLVISVAGTAGAFDPYVGAFPNSWFYIEIFNPAVSLVS